MTLPFQMIWGVYPWGGTYLDPEHAQAKRWIHHPRWVDAMQKSLDDAGWTDATMKKQ